jgi:hypothetical protein
MNEQIAEFCFEFEYKVSIDIAKTGFCNWFIHVSISNDKYRIYKFTNSNIFDTVKFDMINIDRSI